MARQFKTGILITGDAKGAVNALNLTQREMKNLRLEQARANKGFAAGVQQMRNLSIIFTLGCLVIVSVLGFLFARSIVRPLVNMTEVMRAYAESDLFVLASRVARDGDRDGLPNVLMEAQSQGLACIATRISAIPELIEHEVSGVLVPQKDPEALAAALQRLITSPSCRARLGRAAELRVREAFSYEQGVDRLAAKLRHAESVGAA